MTETTTPARRTRQAGGYQERTGHPSRQNAAQAARNWLQANGVAMPRGYGKDYKTFEEPGGTWAWEATAQPAQPALALVAAEPPPRPTQAANRRIRDELDACYNEGVGYAGSWSDAKVAESLDVPRAWVAELREALYGPDTNEEAARAAQEAAQRHAEAEAKITAAEAVATKLLEMAAEAEQLVNDMRAARLAA